MSDKKKMSKKKKVLIILGMRLIISGLFTLRVVRNSVCKFTAYTICIAPDYGPSRYDPELYYQSLERNKKGKQEK